MTTNGKTILKGFYRFSFVFNHNSAASFPLIEELEKSQVDENWIGMEEEKKRKKISAQQRATYDEQREIQRKFKLTCHLTMMSDDFKFVMTRKFYDRARQTFKEASNSFT